MQKIQLTHLDNSFQATTKKECISVYFINLHGHMFSVIFQILGYFGWSSQRSVLGCKMFQRVKPRGSWLDNDHDDYKSNQAKDEKHHDA